MTIRHTVLLIEWDDEDMQPVVATPDDQIEWEYYLNMGDFPTASVKVLEPMAVISNAGWPYVPEVGQHAPSYYSPLYGDPARLNKAGQRRLIRDGVLDVRYKL